MRAWIRAWMCAWMCAWMRAWGNILGNKNMCLDACLDACLDGAWIVPPACLDVPGSNDVCLDPTMCAWINLDVPGSKHAKNHRVL